MEYVLKGLRRWRFLRNAYRESHNGDRWVRTWINQATFTQRRKPTKLERTFAYTMNKMYLKLHCRKGKESHKPMCVLKGQTLSSQRCRNMMCYEDSIQLLSSPVQTHTFQLQIWPVYSNQRKQSCPQETLSSLLIQHDKVTVQAERLAKL